jgi:transposase-like protein
MDCIDCIDEREVEETACPTCEGTNIGNYMGRLGDLEYYRCRYCGADYNKDS